MREVEFDFTNESYVVVGASSGIGRQIAIELAESNANVLAIARNEERLNEVKNKYPNRIEIKTLDVMTATDSDYKILFDDYVHRHGKINGGIYTAGITGDTPLKSYEEKLANEIVSTSVRGGIIYS